MKDPKQIIKISYAIYNNIIKDNNWMKAIVYN